MNSNKKKLLSLSSSQKPKVQTTLNDFLSPKSDFLGSKVSKYESPKKTSKPVAAIKPQSSHIGFDDDSMPSPDFQQGSRSSAAVTPRGGSVSNQPSPIGSSRPRRTRTNPLKFWEGERQCISERDGEIVVEIEKPPAVIEKKRKTNEYEDVPKTKEPLKTAQKASEMVMDGDDEEEKDEDSRIKTLSKKKRTLKQKEVTKKTKKEQSSRSSAAVTPRGGSVSNQPSPIGSSRPRRTRTNPLKFWEGERQCISERDGEIVVEIEKPPAVIEKKRKTNEYEDVPKTKEPLKTAQKASEMVMDGDDEEEKDEDSRIKTLSKKKRTLKQKEVTKKTKKEQSSRSSAAVTPRGGSVSNQPSPIVEAERAQRASLENTVKEYTGALQDAETLYKELAMTKANLKKIVEQRDKALADLEQDEYEPTDQELNSGLPLLQHIWEKIILHLPREDQNNVALVCKLLHSFVSYVQDKKSISLVFGDRKACNTGVEIQDLEEFKKKLQGPQFVYSVSICKNRNSLKALYMLFEFRSVCQNLERLEVQLKDYFEANIIKVPTFPNLKRLKFVNKDDGVCSMINQFLTNSPQLHDLCVRLAPINECQFLSVLPTSIKRLECDLTSRKSLENLILGIENGFVLEKLIVKLIISFVLDNLDVFFMLIHCINRNCKLTEFGVTECSEFLYYFEGIFYNLKRFAISSSPLSEDSARSFFRFCNTIEHVHINDKGVTSCRDYTEVMRAFSELPNLTSVHLDFEPSDRCLEIIAHSVPSLRVIKFRMMIFLPQCGYMSLTLTGFQSFVKKVQKTLKFIELERGTCDLQDDLIKCVAEALDKPNTMTLKLPPGKVGNDVAYVGDLTVIHGNQRFKF